MNQPAEPDPLLPRTVEALTADWLEAALARAGIHVGVASVEQARIIWGTATKVFLQVHYRDDGAGLPSRLCIKGGFDEQARAFGLADAYELEARFFREIAPGLDIPLPLCLSAEVEAGQGVIVFEDLTARGVTFPDVVAGLPVETVAQALEVMARWQAQSWGERAPRRPWLPVGCRAARSALEVLLEEEMFAALTSRHIVPPLPAGLRDGASVRAAYRALWAGDDISELTLGHGDAHLGQLFLDPKAGPAFLDWQGACLAPWAADVAYLIGGALAVPERRAQERALLDHYRGALAGAGGPRLAAEEAWRAYRRQTLHGFIWAVTPTHLQPEPVVAALTARYLAAIDDHNPVALLD